MSKIASKLSKLLIKTENTISFAESCTGGLLVYQIIKNTNASKILKQSYITYSNKSKISILKVKKQTLKKHGAVSKQCVKQMAKGLHTITNSDFSVSVSGIAGPDGGSKNKPLGLVYACILYNSKKYVYKLNLKGNRIKIQQKASKFILKQLYKICMNNR